MAGKILDWGGLTLWVAGFCAILILSSLAPDNRSVVPAYRLAAEMFAAGKPLYNLDLAMGYLYPPAFAALFMPFAKLGPVAGDLLWRLLGFAVLTYAAVRQVARLDPGNRVWMLSYGLFLAVPVAAGALRNGQATVLLTGACWLLVLSALEGRRAETLLWATLALIAKPTAIVVLLLTGALRPKLIPTLLLSVLLLLLLPYAFAPAGYVNQLYGDFSKLMTSMSFDRSKAFEPADFTAPFAAMGVPLSENLATGIRIVAAFATLWLVVWYDRNLDRQFSGLAVFLAAAFYMCIFNPRVEHNTFIMLALPAGVAIAVMWENGSRGALHAVLAILLFLSGLTGLFEQVHDLIRLWFRPIIMTVITLPLLWWFRASSRSQSRLSRLDTHA
ncbi:glycosyltransferase family 87 protein [Mesorhizobium sp. SP-1A]|uniref:glycosyltransferase family 87 protein n=1 Tax=Mesorhizobium sp. SP-1A TaxID=3077840 RepID=UPI0028F6D41C|nr:glycosyltransferase family 87 protein [Mesorhizobium sp. SP-1A]